MITEIGVDCDGSCIEIFDKRNLKKEEGEKNDDKGEKKFKDETFIISSDYSESLEESSLEMNEEGDATFFSWYSIKIKLHFILSFMFLYF